MSLVKRSYGFWAVLLVAVLVPATMLANKRLYQANIKDEGGSTVGSSIIFVNQAVQYQYQARTFALGGSQVMQVWLGPTDGSWQVLLCTNGGPTEDDCAYDGTGNLDIDGSITPSMLLGAGVSGSDFNGALNGGTLNIYLSNGAILGSGVYVRII